MDLASKKCVPCEGGEPPLTRAQAQGYLKKVVDWNLVDNERLKISKDFKFPNYMEGIKFVNRIAEIAESEGHHPDMLVGWCKVKVELMTHAIGGLSENDFIMAAKIDKLTDGS